MATTSEARALPYFTDLYGSPLESGSIYIGQPGLDPVAYPAIVTSDAEGLIVLSQPIRTVHGHAVSAGAQVHLFCPLPYSITILDAAGRTVDASSNETDPTITTLNKTSVQSAGSLAELRARIGSSTNLVWVAGYGMYAYSPTDTTSPENIPFMIVGSDGSRYALNPNYGNMNWGLVALPSVSPVTEGLWLSWNDSGDGIAHFTNNRGAGNGGMVFSNINVGNTVELGRWTMTSTGGLNTTGVISSAVGINTSVGDIRAAGALITNGGTLSLKSDGTRGLAWDQVNQQYVLNSSPLLINNSFAVRIADLVNINQNQLVGAILLNQGSPAPSPTPGTWVALASSLGSSGISQWLRIA